MSKFIHEQCFGVLDDHCKPAKLYLRGKSVKVAELLDCWADTGEWWKGESEKMFYRLQLEPGQVMEIYYDLVAREWWTYKVYD